MRQHATLQKRRQLPLDEARHQTLTATLTLQESFELFGDDAMKVALRRVARAVICLRITNVET